MLQLQYQPVLSEERLPDGRLRIVLAADRRHDFLSRAGLAAAVLAVVVLPLPSDSALIYLPAMMLLVSSAVAGILLTIMTPRHQTSTLELSADGVRIVTTVLGDPVDHYHPRKEIVSVTAVRYGLEVRTTKNQHNLPVSADRRRLEDVAQRVRSELNLAAF